jgi:uncharacterized protein (TIGR02285 family)
MQTTARFRPAVVFYGKFESQPAPVDAPQSCRYARLNHAAESLNRKTGLSQESDVPHPALASLTTTLLLGATLAAAQTPIVLQHDKRPPFLKIEADGSVSGTAATPAAQAFQKAGIPYVWKYESAARQVAQIQSGARVCSVGWYKTLERERYAKFSKPISQDTPMIALANSSFEAQGKADLDQILSNPEVTVLVKTSIVYGPYLEPRFARMKAKRVATYEEFGAMIRLINLGRAQITFIPIEEAEYYIEKMGYSRNDFNIIHFDDMPPGEKRYIMCSKSIEDDVMARLDAGIK